MTASSSHEDNDLWAEVTKTVTPANRDDVLIKKQTKPAKKKTADKKPKVTANAGLSPILQNPQSKPFIKPADLRSKAPSMRAGIDNASAKRLTKGHFSIDDRIDLHGQTEAQAHKALMQFVQQAVRNGARTLLVITGKGVMGQGVLRRKVPEWLKEYPLKAHILAISQASGKDGGGGALYVRLRRQRDSQ